MNRKRVGANASLHRTVQKVKRHERVQTAVRKTSKPLAAFVAAALVIGAAAWAGAKVWQKAAHAHALQFRSVSVEGFDVLDSAAIMRAAGLTLPCAFTKVNPKRVERQIRALPWVLEVTLDRKWMRKQLCIRIRERQPLVWLSADSVYLADASGRVLPPALGRLFDLPVISGIPPAEVATGNVSSTAAWKQAMSVFDFLHHKDRELLPMLSEVLVEKERLTLYTISGIRVQIPAAQALARLEKAVFLIRTLAMAGRNQGDVNLCFDRVAYVR